MMNKPILYILLFMLLPSCMVKKLEKPSVALPNSFTPYCKLSAKEPLAQWWRQFNDPLLNTLIDQAVQNNYNLAIAVEKIEEFRAEYQFKKSQLLPQIDGIGTARHTRFSQALLQTSFLTQSNVSFFQLGTDAFWELDFWGKLRHERAAQRYTLEAQIEQMRNVYIILLADVARTYVDLVSSAEQIRIVEKKYCVAQKLVSLFDDRFKAGLSSEIALLTQQQLQNSIAAQRDQLKIAYHKAVNFLAALLGKNPQQLRFSALPCRVPLSKYCISTGIPSELLRRRPDIAQAEKELAAQHELVGAAIASWFPQFTLFGGLSSDSSSGKEWFTGKSLSWFISPSFRWPLLNFGRINATIHVQESRKQQALLRYSNAIIFALKDVEDFLVSYCYNKEQLKLNLEKYCFAKHEKQLFADQYQSGLASEIQLLQAELNELDKAVEVTQTSQAVSSALIGTYKALGGGW